ncbi:MAG: helicase HerA-like domain-containing protein, partial [Allosphingosinicella sp.]
MGDDGAIFIGQGGGGPQRLVLNRANRHGLIAGATGTGKTVTLQGLVEGFSAAGVPSFVADVKGDLSGLAMAGSPMARTHEPFAARAAEIGDSGWSYHDNPVQFWDLFGQQGHPVRATVSEMGPLLLDLDDLQAMLADCAERADELTITYGNISKASVGTIQRSLLQLRSQGGDMFFGEPALAIDDFFGLDDNG